jgi:O-antigen ligase
VEYAHLDEDWTGPAPGPSAGRASRTFLGLFAAGVALDISIGTWLGAHGKQSLVSSLVLGLPLLLPAAWHFVSGGGVRRTPPALIAMAAFVAWSAASALWATQPDDTAQVAAMTRAQLLAVAWLGFQVVRSERDLRSLLAGYVLGCVGIVALAWRNNLMGTLEDWNRFAADGYDPNDMSIYLALGIPMAGYLAGDAGPGRRRRLLALLYVPIALSGIALSGSRTGGIAAAVAIPVLLVTLSVRSRSTAALALAVLVLGAVVELPRIPQASIDRILTVQAEAADGATVGGRNGIWGAGLDVLPAHFLTGVGVGGFGYAIASRTGERIVAHNTPLSIAVELGVVGIVLFFGAFGLALHRARRGGLEIQLLVWSVVGLCFLGIQSLTWEHRKPLWLVLLVALVAGELRADTEPEPDRA